MGLNVSIKLFLDIISLLEEVFEKPSSFFRIMVIIKIFFEKSFVYNKMLFWTQNIQLILDVFSNYWKGWGCWRRWLLSVYINKFWYSCSIICILKTSRRDIRCRFSRRICVIKDINDIKDFGNSSQIYCTGRGRVFWESGTCRVSMERQLNFAICILGNVFYLDIGLW